MRRRWSVWLLGLVWMALPGMALDDMPPSTVGGPTDLRAFVRVVYLAATPAVDVYVDDVRYVRNMAPGTATDYLPVMAGNYSVLFQPAGTAYPTQPVLRWPIKVAPRFFYTVVAAPTAQGMVVGYFQDNPFEPTSGYVRVRFLNLVQNARPLTLSTGGETLATGIGYGMVTPYISHPRGTAGYALMAQGATVPLSQLTMPPARVFTIITYGNALANEPVRNVVLVERE